MKYIGRIFIKILIVHIKNLIEFNVMLLPH